MIMAMIVLCFFRTTRPLNFFGFFLLLFGPLFVAYVADWSARFAVIRGTSPGVGSIRYRMDMK
jgi:hypothetical protein